MLQPLRLLCFVFMVTCVLGLTNRSYGESHFEFFPRSLTVYHEQGSAEFKARIRVTPHIRGSADNPGIHLEVLRIEIIRKDPTGLALVTWLLDLSDCDMWHAFETEVELTGVNGDRIEPCDHNGHFDYRAGDVIAAVNVKYKWLQNEADWSFTHGRRIFDGAPPPFIRSGSLSSPRDYATELESEANELRRLAAEDHELLEELSSEYDLRYT